MSRTVIGNPFDPAILAAEGELPSFPEVADFDPAGTWLHTYRLVGARGFHGENTAVGIIRMKRIAIGEDRFRLGIESRIVLQEAMENRVTANAECSAGQPATPLTWTHLSEHRGPEGNFFPRLRLKQEGETHNGRIKIDVDRHSYHPELSNPWTTEFVLFESLQRLPFAGAPDIYFDLFEDFSMVKRNQRLIYRGPRDFDLGEAGEHRLHRFDHIGSGIVPFEYYLDEAHRLLVAISGNKFLVLDDDERAHATIEAFRERQIGTYNWRQRNPAE